MGRNFLTKLPFLDFEHWETRYMTENEYPRPDEGGVLNTAIAAVMLITAGLGLMVWDNYRDQSQKPRTVVSALNIHN